MPVGPSLDARTLLFAIAMFGFLMAGLSMSSAKAMPDQRRALVEWAKAVASIGGGFLLFFLRDHAPLVIAFVVANVFSAMSVVYGYLAFATLLDLEPRRRLALAIAGFMLGGVMLCFALDVPRSFAVFTMSVGACALFGMTAATLRHSIRRRGAITEWIAAVLIGLLSAAFALRSAIALLGNASSVSINSGSTAQVSTLVLGALFVVGTSFSFLALVHERQRQATLETARRDGLTGVHTRAAFFEIATAAEQDAQNAYAIVMIDIDHFKRINDQYGHTGGDLALAHAARRIAGAVRISDVVGRYGGEEFCVLLRHCGEEQARGLAQRVVLDASQQRVRLADGRTVAYTLSAGYAVCAPQRESGGAQESLASVIERADQALYRAKGEGRNRALGAQAVHATA